MKEDMTDKTEPTPNRQSWNHALLFDGKRWIDTWDANLNGDRVIGMSEDNKTEASVPLAVVFEVPDSTPDIQMMHVWAESLERFDVTPEHKTAALEWFKSYAESEIKKQKVDQGNV